MTERKITAAIADERISFSELFTNEFPSVRNNVSIALHSYTFFTENVQNALLFYSSSQRIEYDSNNFAGICCSVAVLRQSLMAARTSSIISDASWCSSM